MSIWLLPQFVWAASVSFPPPSACFSLEGPGCLSVTVGMERRNAVRTRPRGKQGRPPRWDSSRESQREILVVEAGGATVDAPMGGTLSPVGVASYFQRDGAPAQNVMNTNDRVETFGRSVCETRSGTRSRARLRFHRDAQHDVGVSETSDVLAEVCQNVTECRFEIHLFGLARF